MPSKISPDLAAYLDAFPPATRKVLDKIRATVRKAVPDAEEMRSYGVGAFKRGGTYVLYYAGYPKHVSIYPVYADDAALGDALKPYTSGKATAKFALDKPVPSDLIAKIVKAKVAEHRERVEKRTATGKGKTRQAAREALKKSPAKKASAKKAAKKSVKKKAAKKTAKALFDVQNNSWALLKESVAAQGVGKAAKKRASPNKKK